MQKSTIDWHDIQFFLLVARSGSARAAASELQTSHSTVSRRIDQLEKALGVRLFDRGVGGYQLSDDGKSLLNYAQKAEANLLDAEAELTGKDQTLAGVIHLTCPDVIATYLLLPELAEFCDSYPEIELNLHIGTNVLDIEKHEAELALRFVSIKSELPENVIGRKLCAAASCFYARPDYIKNKLNRGQGRWLGWGQMQKSPRWVGFSPHPELEAWHGLADGRLQLEAARAGMGMAHLPCFLGDNTQELQRLPGADTKHLNHIWMISNSKQRDVARLKVFKQFLLGLFEKKRELIEGQLT
ncbi:LysR family transcriptional regulator [Agaribacterium haliotis]|uniref:LysR family transcriptional regulator n=1 Tax=Agaribacterium haliotis TaxID=2013869 RepID=UPI000BB55623|nr:LysR family transcriptional regulator [Agaribacterium haliotis]